MICNISSYKKKKKHIMNFNLSINSYKDYNNSINQITQNQINKQSSN
mgnify:CR=1 FL=1